MSKYQVNDHSVLTVSDQEAKDGESWHKLARERAKKQHGEGEEIPEGDIHAVKKHYHHQTLPHVNPEETKVALDALEEKIKQLQSRKEQAPPPPPQAKKSEAEEFDDWFKE